MTLKNDKSAVKFNCAKRAIHVHNRVSASLNTGSHKLQSGYSNGDCLLLDMHNLFFAVSDSTDRRPEASKNFLLRLMDTLYSEKSLNTKDELFAAINGLYATQKYVDRATFSGLSLKVDGNKRTAVILHGGDSIVLIVNVKAKDIKYQTGSNMNFVGRAKGLSDAVEIPLEDKNDIIIMGSDGISDIARLSKLTLEEMCIAATTRYSVDDVPLRIAHLLDSQKETLNHDDIGIIAIDPCKINPIPETCLLMGGTVPDQEKKYSQHLEENKIPDKWFDISMPDLPEEILKTTGIIIR